MTTGFISIRLDDYVEQHVRANAVVERKDLIARLRYTIAAAQRGERCQCGRLIWIIGSAEVGLSCFTCMTGESTPDNDYEIDLTEFKNTAEPGAPANAG